MAKTKETPEENKVQQTETKPVSDVIQDFTKPYKDENGRFIENGRVKYYIVNKDIKQVEKDGKLVDAETGTECSYFENLTAEEAEARKSAGQIF